MDQPRLRALPKELEYLGQPVRVFSKNAARFAPAVLILFVFALGIFLVWLGMQPDDGPVGERAAIGGVGAVVACVAALILRWRLRRCELVQCENGLAKIVGRHATACRWDDIQKVYWRCGARHAGAKKADADHHAYRLVCKEAGTIVFASTFFRGLRDMDQVLHQNVYSRLLDEAVGALHRGETVGFDLFEVSTEGISKGRSDVLIAWSEILSSLGEPAGADGTRILEYVQQHDRAFRDLTVEQIPNLPVLLALLESVYRTLK